MSTPTGHEPSPKQGERKMQTLQIGIVHPKAMNLLRELDSLNLITIVQPEVYNKELSDKSQTIDKNSKRPVFGCAKGQFWMSDDFDAPLEDFAEYM